MQRKLAAILAADVVGYSRLMRADETGTLAAMKALWAEVVQPSVRAHRGRVFKLMGDGMLAEFASVVDAANAAEAIQTEANERASDAEAEDQAILLRIGINLGDVVVDGSDLYGDGVNIAARLQEVAEPGGIAVSEDTHRQLRGKSEIAFADGGHRALKNIADSVHVWLWPSATPAGHDHEPPPSAQSGLPAATSRSSQPSIAVLPFQNLSSDPDAEFFADGMTEDVINALSKFRWLFVIARGTMFTYKGQNASPAQVAGDLGVRFVVESSVRQAGQRIRVSVQLVDTESGNHLWTQRYDRQLDDIFAIQDEITEAVAGAIAPEIERFEQRRADTASATDVDVWLLYQKGQHAANRRSEQDLVEAIAYFDEANRLEPKFVPALAMAAINLMILGNIYRGDELEDLSKAATEKADLASSIDPSEPLAMLAQSRIHTGLGNHTQAMALARKAVEANSSNASAHGRAAAAAMVAAKFEECIYHSDMVLKLSPFDPFESVVKSYRAFCYYFLGEHEKALEAALSATNPKQMNMIHRSMVAVVLMKLGHADEARASIAEIARDYPQFSQTTIRHGNRNASPELLNPFLEGLRELGVPEE